MRKESTRLWEQAQEDLDTADKLASQTESRGDTVGEKGIKIRNIEQLREVLCKSPIPIKSAFLFGSRARGDYLEESDWDIMIVSPQFAGIPFPDTATIFLRNIPLRRVELLCYTEDEFQSRVVELGIVAEAAKGKRLV